MSHRIYREDASWFELLTTPSDYVEEAALYQRAFRQHADGPVRNILELGAGGGNIATLLKEHAALTLVDLSPAMLAISEARNPECEHVVGDMRSVRLERTFDVVFVHDAVTYMTSVEDLQRLAETAFLHARPGAALVLVPKFVQETFAPITRHGGHDAPPESPDGRAMRWLHWCTDPDPADTTYNVLLTWVLREADGSYRSESEEHINGLFPRRVWQEVLEAAGFRTPTIEETGRSVLITTTRPGREP